jgi:hypothetical protein
MKTLWKEDVFQNKNATVSCCIIILKNQLLQLLHINRYGCRQFASVGAVQTVSHL